MDLPIRVILFQAPDGKCRAAAPALPGFSAEADSREALLVGLREALVAWVEARNESTIEMEGQNLPEALLI